MSGNEFLQWTLAIAIWAVFIIPVSVLCGCMVFIVISNQIQARRLGKMGPSVFGAVNVPPPAGDNILVYRPIERPLPDRMILIKEPKEPA